MKIDRREALSRMALSGILISINPLRNLFSGNPVEADSAFFKYALNPDFPRFDYLSIDSLGKSKLDNSPLILSEINQTSFRSEGSGGTTRYYFKDNQNTAAWEFIPTNRGFILRSNFVEGNVPWVIKFNQRKNHATVLGLVPEKNKISTPCIIHLPDMGSFKVRSTQVELLDYTSKRRDVPVHFVQISFPAADHSNPTVEYSFEIDAIYPALKKIAGDPRFDGYRRNYINTFQVNPNTGLLANNSSSDSCAFVQYGYSEVALLSPNLVDDLKAIDLVGMTVDRYLSGTKGYGMKGYKYDSPGTELVKWGGNLVLLTPFHLS